LDVKEFSKDYFGSARSESNFSILPVEIDSISAFKTKATSTDRTPTEADIR